MKTAKFQVHRINRKGNLVISEKELKVYPEKMNPHQRRLLALEVKQAAFERVSKRGDEEKALRLQKEINNLKAKIESYSTTIN